MNEENLKFLEDYESWKLDLMLSSRNATAPEEYVKHLINKQNQATLDKALAFIERYEKGSPWPQEIVESLVKILRNETE